MFPEDTDADVTGVQLIRNHLGGARANQCFFVCSQRAPAHPKFHILAILLNFGLYDTLV